MKVLKFGATWCAGCIIMKPRWQEIEQENPWLETQYFDFDTDKEAIEKHEINDILPVFVFLNKEGKEILRLQGEVDKSKLIEVINENKDK